MSNQTIVQILRDKAAQDPVISAVLHMWALRQRARSEVTLNGLAAKMKKEGFIHSKSQYEPLLKLMAQLGLGKLQTDSSGRVVALKHVEMKLQSLGHAVCDSKTNPSLVSTRRKHRFKSMELAYETKSTVKTLKEASVTIEDPMKSVTFKVPSGTTDDQLTDMVKKYLRFASSA